MTHAPASPLTLNRSNCSCNDLIASIDASHCGVDQRMFGWRAALARPDALQSHYQPIVDVRCASVVGYEALLRVPDPGSGGMLNPGELFQAAIDGGWHQALDQAARRCSILGARHWLGRRWLFVNFLPSSIYNPSICLRTTEAAIAEAGIAIDRLVFEVVESERITSIPHLQSIFARYREMGARVALDDLGAGHSTLDVAASLRPDVLKIDGVIARSLPAPSATRFVTEAVELAADIGGQVLIEGVEEQRQLDCAIDLGVDLAQGYLLGRPAPAPAT